MVLDDVVVYRSWSRERRPTFSTGLDESPTILIEKKNAWLSSHTLVCSYRYINILSIIYNFYIIDFIMI